MFAFLCVQSGKHCGKPVNKTKGGFCEYHIQGELKKLGSGRAQLRGGKLHTAMQKAQVLQAGRLCAQIHMSTDQLMSSTCIWWLPSDAVVILGYHGRGLHCAWYSHSERQVVCLAVNAAGGPKQYNI